MISELHKLLHGLLEYVGRLTTNIDPKAFEIPKDSFDRDSFQNIPGIELNATDAEDPVWLKIKRLHSTKPPKVNNQKISKYIIVSDLIEQEPKINQDEFEKHLRLIADELAEDDKSIYSEKLHSEINQFLEQYKIEWNSWKDHEQLVRKSIALYDQFNSWRISLTTSIDSPHELVAGLGYLSWILPKGTQSYCYQLITVYLEVLLIDGYICVLPKNALPKLELDLLMAQENIGNIGIIKSKASEMLMDGREASPFDKPSISDVLKYISDELDSRCKLVDSEEIFKPSVDPVVSFGWKLFVRPRSSAVIDGDIDRLQKELEGGCELTEQSKSLVIPPSAHATENGILSFRGREGISGSGGNIQELYFPLPYNKEQITIIEELGRSSGVVVQGPPGTGKTHTIANIISHYLANGKKILVSAEKAHVLKTIQEKLPERLRPLVISRTGTDSESRKQLEYSITTILQELSQIKPTMLSDNIDRAKKRIDIVHSEMQRVDKQIDEIARLQFSEIEIDGLKQRPNKLAQQVVDGESNYSWFDDDLALVDENAPPLNQTQYGELRAARRSVADSLKYLKSGFPPFEKLPPVPEVVEINESLKKVNEIKAKEQAGSLPTIKLVAENLSLVLNEHKKTLLLYLSKYEDFEACNNSLDLLALKDKISKNAVDPEILDSLIKQFDVLRLIRNEFLVRPIEMSNEVIADQKCLNYISEGARTGKPFSLFDIASSKSKNTVRSIKIDGLKINTSIKDQWEWASKYLELRDATLSFISRWNRISDDLALPILDLSDSDLISYLKVIEGFVFSLKISKEIFVSIDGRAKKINDEIFGSSASDIIYNSSHGVSRILVNIEYHLDKLVLERSKVRLSEIQQFIARYNDDISEHIKNIFISIGETQNSSIITIDYSSCLEKLRLLSSFADSYSLINNYSEQIRSAGAIKFANRLRNIPVAPMGEDIVLRSDWVDAWNWSRIKNFLYGISDRSKLVELFQERKTCELKLSRLYEDIATHQSWLALAKNVSPKVKAALNRYKAAVTKIGKGTGKSAPMWRKEARLAMEEAAEAIPCWIMTQFQVSESMPSKIGVFNLVIIDEASQSNISALPVLMRGEQVLIVGDDKQVSPSNVGVAVDTVQAIINKYLHEQPRGKSFWPNLSLYDTASQIYGAQVMLLEHFRCHPAIIEYSNTHYYDNKIRPLRISTPSERIDPPLVSIYVPEGVRGELKSHAINKAEAEAIVHEISQILSNASFENRSLGIISLLGPAQAEYIQTLCYDSFDPLELQKRDFACGEPSSFQGSERDIILLSMVASPADKHPLSRTEHQQRFNVAASRARERLYLFHSVKLDELSPVDLRIGLLAHFHSKKEMSSDSLESLLEICESDFERDVLSEIFNKGYKVIPQLKVGGFRLDMVIEGQGDARLAVECDGDSFHGPDQWPADLARQRSLERAGWVFWRCFASTWAIQREESISNLISTLESLGIEPSFGVTSTTNLTEARIWQRPITENIS